jgi:hypothetical protein
VVEALESRRLLSVTNLIEGVGGPAAGGFTPADPHGAAGPGHVVNVVNSHVQWFTKAGTLQRSEDLNTFFAPLGTNVTSFVFDPKVIYDQYNDRFVIVALWLEQIADGDLVNDSHALVAVSDDADPNGVWHFQDIDTKVNINGEDTWFDYPGLAVSPDAIYLTGNMFSFDFATTVPTTAPAFGVAGTRLFIIPTDSLYNGGRSFVRPGGYDPAVQLGLTPGDRVPGVQSLLTLQPAHMYGALPTGLGTFLTLDAGDDAATGRDRVYIIRVDNPLGVPVFSSTLLDVGDISTRRFTGVPQPFSQSIIERFLSNGDTYARLRANDPRVLSAVWRDGMLYATQVVVPPEGQADAGQITAHWYQFSTGSATTVTTPSLFDQGNIYGEEIGVGVNTFFPAVSVNPRGDMAIGFSASGPLSVDNGQGTTPVSAPVYPGAYVTTQLKSDRDLGRRGFTRPAQVLAAGGGFYLTGELGGSSFVMRWGDYSGISVDIDAFGNETNAFWAYNKYAGPPTDNILGIDFTSDWSTRWGRFVPELFDLPAVGNFVWDDRNGNGLQDVGEPGLAGVIFRLVEEGTGNIVHQAVSDANGMWYLQGPPSGGATVGAVYRVVADIGSPVGPTGRNLFDGYTYSLPGRDPAGRSDSDFTMVSADPLKAQTVPITFTAGMFDETIDLGLFKPFVTITALTPTIAEDGPGAVKQARFRLTLSHGVTDAGGVPVAAVSPWDTRVYYSTMGRETLPAELQVVPPPGTSATSEVDFFGRSFELIVIPALASTLDADLVPVLGDALPEGDEKFAVILLQPEEIYGLVNENLPPGVPPSELLLYNTSQFRSETERSALVTILDDDQAVVSVDRGPTVIEPGAGRVAYALFTVRLNVPNPLARSVSVRYTLANGSATGGAAATEGVDFGNASGTVAFAPGQLTKTIRIPVFGDFVREGNETFTLVVEAVDSDLTNDTQSGRTATATIVNLGTKTQSFSAKKSLTFRDSANNMVTITLSGPGSGSVVTTSRGEGRELVLNGTTERSVLTIRTNRGQANFGGITVNGGLAALNAPTTNISGSLTSEDAIRSLTLNFVTGGQIVLGRAGARNVFVDVNVNRIANSSLTSETSIRALNLGSWIDTGDEDFLIAPAIRSIRATGDFGASVRPVSGDLGTMTVGGVLKGSEVTVRRTAGGQARGSIGTVTVGSLLDSVITAAAKIDAVVVRKVFSNSTIRAPRIDRLELGSVRNTTGSVLVAAEADRIGSVRWTSGKRTQTIRNVDNPGERGLDRDEDRNPRIILQIT